LLLAVIIKNGRSPFSNSGIHSTYMYRTKRVDRFHQSPHQTLQIIAV